MYLVLGLIYSYSYQNIVVLVEGKTHQWNKIGNPDIDPYTYTQLISDKGTKKKFSGGKIAFSANGFGVIGYL